MKENKTAMNAQLPESPQLDMMRQLRDAFTGFILHYEFAIDEVMTKINVLQSEFEHMHEYSPIEHVTSRLKSVESIIAKVQRRGGPTSLSGIRETVRDIAGVRVVCSFIADAYKIADALTQQQDVTVLEIKDYIKNPKPNGYRSLHLLIEVPVFLSSGPVDVPVEVQIRTIAMDFWASLEHKIYYKFESEIPEALLAGLHEAAVTAGQLDVQMEQIHNEVTKLRPARPRYSTLASDQEIEFPSPAELRRLLDLND
ncbi:putative GTP pyrophosphokinase [Ruaniaceae bacterium KH17]|nr:putative GTP pyrophosphokinase [Ruaniaceae bacterium KH17]